MLLLRSGMWLVAEGAYRSRYCDPMIDFTAPKGQRSLLDAFCSCVGDSAWGGGAEDKSAAGTTATSQHAVYVEWATGSWDIGSEWDGGEADQGKLGSVSIAPASGQEVKEDGRRPRASLIFELGWMRDRWVFSKRIEVDEAALLMGFHELEV